MDNKVDFHLGVDDKRCNGGYFSDSSTLYRVSFFLPSVTLARPRPLQTPK